MKKGVKKTMVINVFVDPENGFLKLGLTDEQGGVLYVRDGEQVVPIMGNMIENSRNTTFILGQDYHPAHHISFMVNHPGVMQYRIEKFKEFLSQNGQPVPADAEETFTRAQQPVHLINGQLAPFPFNEIVFDESRNIVGLKEADGRIRKVRVDTASGLAPSEKDRGRVTKVLDEYHYKTFDQYRAEGRLLHTQTLWTKHCVQGTESCHYPLGLNLPPALVAKIAGDMMSKVISHFDGATGNRFFVIRKGGDSEVDSYGIGVENDGETMTEAWTAFRQIAQELKGNGYEKVIINVGGLATNFCVEFSANNIADFLAGHFKMRGMDVDINFVPEISRGIPIPGGADVPFSLEGAAERMKRSRNIGTKSVKEIQALTSPVAPARSATAQFPKFGK